MSNYNKNISNLYLYSLAYLHLKPFVNHKEYKILFFIDYYSVVLK